MNNLKVWWIPQVPGNRFEVDVETVADGVKIMTTLAQYDLFQYKNKIKPDYANAGGLMMLEDDEWVDWFDDEWGTDDPYEYLEIKAGEAA